MKNLFQQIIRFGIIGGIATVIDWSTLYVCTEYFGIYYLISGVISFTVATVFNYYASVKWVFHVDPNKSKKKTFTTFIVFSVIGLGINEFVMKYCVESFGIYYMYSRVIATAVTMVFNFITRKIFLE
ncbi:GtrA family protein [Catenisphaera adipataccumulans]|jgi:putative flippase GtrA|uniref:Putative flippase GtrA n=1 Tax=Catenisphaera adipataccumulans TaxID=700500 RepID=A0A7W8FV90_9FIRM|nr:GtrA family protein [Catenisphaera adipataccumulans]MBB5182888.1 putative flippase GtrA [Catenisphaera adipataccumulans]